MKRSYLYVIEALTGDRGDGKALFKVGITDDVKQRLATIATSCPYEVFVVGVRGFLTRSDAAAVEKRAHQRLRFCQTTREWFFAYLYGALGEIDCSIAEHYLDQDYGPLDTILEMTGCGYSYDHARDVVTSLCGDVL